MERIHVAVRARPLSLEDAKTSPWKFSANSIFLSNHSTKFDFDRIFGEECRTTQVYEAQTRDIVAAAVRGFNGTVFVYGPTNIGKTHTIRGSTAELEVIPLAMRDLFHFIQEADTCHHKSTSIAALVTVKFGGHGLMAKNLGEEAYDNFLDHTSLGDRRTTIREYFATTGSGIMEEEPPESLKKRYGG